MTLQRKNVWWFIFLLVYVALYYVWLSIWKSDHGILTLGGNLFSIFGGAISTIWLLLAANRTSKCGKPFWFLLAAGTYSFFLAQFLWLSYENILKIEVPSPGIPDLFFLLQVGFYLAAFSYKVIMEKQQLDFIRFIFDILIVMTVAFTFSWYFLLQPLIAISEVSAFSLAVTLAYPIGDLALLFGLIILFLGVQQTVFDKTIIFLFLGWLTQIIADSSFLYYVSIDEYSAGGIGDPLFTLAVLLIGLTGLASKGEKAGEQVSVIKKRPNRILNTVRIIFPYISVAVLFVFMILRSSGIDTLTIGSGFSILLVIIRQIFVLTENQKLLHQVHDTKEILKTGDTESKAMVYSPKYSDSETKIQFLAYHDSLTGLANRAFFETMLNQAVSDAQLHNDSFAIMFLDLDNFKQVNDTMGHDAGDQLLILIADRLKACTRKDDVVARLGGDEFTFLIRNVSNPQNAAFIAEKIIYSLAQPYTVNGQDVSSSPSIGISLYPLHGTTPSGLLKKADMAMYQVKEKGKGHYRMAETEESLMK
ncbi:diguanylate cyclase (GGDEF)-like protein [Planomicrobium soli]|uniref:Diguanylate cyclase (GGDEF)-like protein n=1 Tax=Planomicrobium soli TaxID=1176648 RepID=A0A2P8H1Q3_9BACL|nr:diguanylate cyclase [Planomicrobium soli]PSL40142.1 diguanylate cyclase (GGDEF)-like protein [Planomicrobium soli]